MGQFDPYYTWLGIRPADQPPHHYRLLAIDPFEDDSDVIFNAADQRMAHVRSFQTGQRQQLAEKILNEIAAARVVLLNIDKKRRYDEELRAKLGVAQDSSQDESRASTQRPVLKTRARESMHSQLEVSTTSTGGTRNGTGKKLAVAIAVVLIIVVAGVVTLNLGEDESTSAAVQTAEGSTPDEERSATLTKRELDATADASVDAVPDQQSGMADLPKSERPTPAHEEALLVGSEAIKDPQPESQTAEKTSPSIEPAAPPIVLTQLKPADESPAETRNAESQADDESTKSPVPDAAAIEAAKKLMLEVFGEEIKTARQPDEKAALASRLLDAAVETERNLAARYVLLQQVLELARESGDVDLIARVYDDLAARFDVDALRLRASSLWEVSRQPFSRDVHQDVVKHAFELLDQAVSNERFDIAVPLEKVLQNSARRLRERELFQEVRERMESVDKYAQEFQDADDARKRLADNPEDPKAHEIVGLYLCLVKSDWAKGLNHLAQAEDSALSEAAQLDLAQPEKADEQVKLADFWFERAEKGGNDGFYRRAEYWYRQAAPNLQGLVLAKVEKQRKSIAERVSNLGQSAGAGTSGNSVFATIPDGATVKLNETLVARIACPSGQPARHVAFSPRGTTMAFSDWAGNIYVLQDVAAPDAIRTIVAGKKTVNVLQFSPDGKSFATGSEDGVVGIWDAKTGERKLLGKSAGAVSRLAFSTNGETLYTADWDAFALLAWNVKSGAVRGELKIPDLWCVTTSLDGELLACGTRKNQIFLFKSGKPAGQLTGHSTKVVDLQFAPVRKVMYSAGETDGLKAWDTSGKIVQEIPLGTWCRDLDISSDGRFLIVNTREGVKVFDAQSGEAIGPLGSGGDGYGACFSSDDRYVAAAYKDLHILVWELKPTAVQ